MRQGSTLLAAATFDWPAHTASLAISVTGAVGAVRTAGRGVAAGFFATGGVGGAGVGMAVRLGVVAGVGVAVSAAEVDIPATVG